MTLRRRILLCYCLTLAAALVIIGFWSWFEFQEVQNVVIHQGIEAVLKESPLLESFEIVLYGGVPAALLGILGGALLIRAALRPIETLTDALEKTNADNLNETVPRSGNGDEIDRMAAVFNVMRARLGSSFTQAREFTLNASHELKTPLTIMHGTLEQMLADEATPAHHREKVASILEEVQRLSGIVGQLTFLAKADAGLLTTSCETVAFDELVRDVTEDLQLLAASQEISVTLTRCDAVLVSGDRMRLRQLLLNLADNSVKYNHPNGLVRLSLKATPEHACFEIENTGPALDADLHARVFERFFRGDSSHGTAVEGSGLGLSIAQSIAHAHRGTLVMQTSAEGLTRLRLDLPKLNSDTSRIPA